MDGEDIDFTLQLVEEEDINNIFADELDVDCELLSQIRIIDESPSKSTEIVIHQDLAEQLRLSGFEDIPIQFIPDVKPVEIVPVHGQGNSSTQDTSNAPSTTKDCPSCGRAYSRQSYFEKHVKICHGTNGKCRRCI